MATIETATSLASNYFGQPPWLLAALALIPLLLFYLVRPKPEEQIMPSMMFFMKDRTSGKVSQALQKLMRNLLLLLHILMVLGFAAALAHPYIEGVQRPDNTVVVFDRSASMENDLSGARNFVQSNMGAENTLIIVDNGVTVAVEQASRSQVMNRLRNTQTLDVETDIAAGLESAAAYEGQVVVASDLDQSINSRDAAALVGQLRQNRRVKVYEADNSNKWGIISVEPGEQNATVDIKNFQEQPDTVTLRANGGGRQIEIDADSVETVTVSVEPGENTVELGEDGVKADNTAYISVPEQRTFQVTYVADQNNPYLQKAVELIEFTDYNYVEPPIDTGLSGDIYVVGPTDEILRSTAESIGNQVRDGKGLVLFGQEGMSSMGFQNIPGAGRPQQTDVEIVEPVRASIATETHPLNPDGFESYTTPDHAIMKSDYGDGELLIYNIDDADFNQEFVYPIFWKRVFEDLAEKPSVNQINRETGDTVEGRFIITPTGERFEGSADMNEAGFYNVSNTIYAANLESEPESGTETVETGSGEVDTERTDQDVQNLAVIILGAVVLAELLYLFYIGEV